MCAPVLRSLTAEAVKLPMKRPLGTSARRIDEACLLLVDLLTEDGVEGHGYAFCYLPSIARSLVPLVAELGEQLAGLPLATVCAENPKSDRNGDEVRPGWHVNE